MAEQVTPSGAVDTPAPDPPRLRPDPGAPPGPGGDHPLSNRARLARLTRLGTRSQGADPVLEPLFAAIRSNYPKAELREVERAYRIAEHHHRDQLRRSGEPYITHPLAVTQILAEMGMTPPTLCAALLHDTVEDTEYTLDLLREDFGDEVAELVDGVTKLDKVTYGQATQAETVRKMVVAMARDIRVLVIKLADRLHNMRTLALPARGEAAAEGPRDARDLRAAGPPARHEHPEVGARGPVVRDPLPEDVRRDRPAGRPRRPRAASSSSARSIEQISGDLREAKIKATVTGRPKHYYSVYQKMIVRGRELEDIYDLVGIRVLVDTVSDCYGVLGVVHTRWSPVPGRFKDFIAMPKFNMYQSLHTTVIGPEGKPVELQIRTWDMHRRAEYGIAAHWKYKEGPSRFGKSAPAAGGEGDLAWLRQILDWQAESADPGEFLESLRFDLGPRQVFVFTPKGDVVALPDGSTPVDFAYSVHTEVGHRCIGARVNGKLVPLESALANGDVVEVFTSKAESAGPSRDWLGFVQSGRARSKIKAWFSKERREEAIEQGKEALTRAMRKQGLPLQRLLSEQRGARHRPRLPLHRHHLAVRGDRRGPGLRGDRGPAAGPLDGRRGGRGRGPRRDRHPEPDRGPAQRPPGRPGRHRRPAPPTSGSSSPSAARRCPATPCSASSPAATASRCTARTASTWPRCGRRRAGSPRWSGRPQRARCSWCRSRSRRSTGRGCSPT